MLPLLLALLAAAPGETSPSTIIVKVETTVPAVTSGALEAALVEEVRAVPGLTPVLQSRLAALTAQYPGPQSCEDDCPPEVALARDATRMLLVTVHALGSSHLVGVNLLGLRSGVSLATASDRLKGGSAADALRLARKLSAEVLRSRRVTGPDEVPVKLVPASVTLTVAVSAREGLDLDKRTAARLVERIVAAVKKEPGFDALPEGRAGPLATRTLTAQVHASGDQTLVALTLNERASGKQLAEGGGPVPAGALESSMPALVHQLLSQPNARAAAP